MSFGDPNKSENEGGYPTGQVITRLLKLAWTYRSGCIQVLLLQFAQLTMVLSALGFLGLGIDIIHSAADPKQPPAVWPFGFQPPAAWTPMMALFAVSMLILVFAFARMILSFLNAVVVNHLVQRKIVVDLRMQVYAKLQTLSFRFYDDSPTGSIINRVTGDVQAVRSFVDGVVLPVMVVMLSLVFYLNYMLRLHVWLTIACLFTTPALWVLMVRFSRRVRPAYLRNRELADRMILRLAETVQGIAVVKCFARDADELRKFSDSAEHVRTQQQWIFRKVSVFTPSIEFLTQVNVFILLFYGGWLVMNGRFPLGTGLVVFASLLANFSAQVNQVAQISNSMQQCLIGARRVFEVLDTPVGVASPAQPVSLGRARGEVAFENVSFQFRTDAPALKDVSFVAKPGAVVAVLGATGSGKTALLSLIPRFYDPDVGRVLLDGVDLRDLDLNALRRQVGLVFQESFLFSTTIAENIAFGNPGADRLRIEQAARLACAHEFITSRPEGYDFRVTEGGKNLSGGQRQRIAIARALLLDPAILVLDDPTASIDAQTEHEILTAMESAMRGRTTFVVAHRLSTLRRSDWVLVLEDGKIVESGTHRELMQRHGHYRRAFSVQIPESHASADARKGGL